MSKKILLTRPQPASNRLALLLRKRGIECIIEPLLVITPTGTSRPEGSFQAIIITSANALDVCQDKREAMADLLELPCFCVGHATEEAACAFGFTRTYCGKSDSAELAQLIVEQRIDKERPLLHIAGDVVDGKAHEILKKAGFSLTSWAVYHANTISEFTPQTQAAFRAGEIAVLPVFSPRSARALIQAIEKHNLTQTCRTITALGLSQAVVSVLQPLPWYRLCAVKAPLEEEVLSRLQTEFFMTQTEKAPPSLPSPPACSKTHFRLWAALGVLGLIGLCLSGFWFCPWLLAMPPQAHPSSEIVGMEQRLAALESRTNLQKEPANVPTTEESVLSNTVRNLQEQVAALQNQGNQSTQSERKRIAALAAFWDLREAAKSGHSFASPLATFRASADVALSTQTEKLDPYALKGVPTLSSLRDELQTQEKDLPPPDDDSVWKQIRVIAQPLIKIRPLHNPSYAALEAALESGDSQASLDLLNTLPDTARKELAPWQAKLEARVAVDVTLNKILSLFITPSNEGGSIP